MIVSIGGDLGLDFARTGCRSAWSTPGCRIFFPVVSVFSLSGSCVSFLIQQQIAR